MEEQIAGRSYARVYRVTGRSDLHTFIQHAVQRAGGEVLHISNPDRAPIYVGVQGDGDERIGILCYPFRCNAAPIKGRPADEHRLQVRYGSEASWDGEHPLGRDVAGVDTTVVLGIHLETELFIGLDPLRYDPLPMGISIEFKQAELDLAVRSGWHVWERENRPGRRRGTSRVGEGLETLIAFAPERLLEYIGFERRASGLGLDPPLRFRAAEVVATDPILPSGRGGRDLEAEFALSSAEILEIIATRARLEVAVRGGVAEHHLQRHLSGDPNVARAEQIDRDGEPDVEVTLVDGSRVLVECKNVSPTTYTDGVPKVEVQKTRSQRDDPAGRFYRPEQFDVVAACLFAVTGSWEFRFKATSDMARHQRHPDRLAVLHRVDDTWSLSVADALAAAEGSR
ncbi:MAG: hypothetical protein AB7O92_18615 [Acidimicrobiia bacterium]